VISCTLSSFVSCRQSAEPRIDSSLDNGAEVAREEARRRVEEEKAKRQSAMESTRVELNQRVQHAQPRTKIALDPAVEAARRAKVEEREHAKATRAQQLREMEKLLDQMTMELGLVENI